MAKFYFLLGESKACRVETMENATEMAKVIFRARTGSMLGAYRHDEPESFVTVFPHWAHNNDIVLP